MAECKIKKIVPLSINKNNPILAHFENGDFLPAGAKNFECFYAQNTNDNNSRHVITTTTDANVYYGKIGHGFPTTSVRTIVAIRNKSTNKLKLVEVEQCSMLSHHIDDKANLILGRELTDIEKRRKLVKTFGSKHAIRSFDRNDDRKKFNMDSVANQLNQTLEELPESRPQSDDEFDKKKMLLDQHMESMTPKLNKDAERLEDVYKLTDLIDEGLFHNLNEEAIAILKLDDVSKVLKIPFIANILKIIQKSKEPDSVANLNKAKVCIYLDALINFVNELKGRHKKMQFVSFSEITKKVETDIRLKFSQPHDKKLVKSTYTVHKATCYAIILSLLISDKYELDVEDLTQALKTSKKYLTQILGSIPVRYKSRTNIIAIQLPSKLPPPKTSFERKRRTF